MNKKHRRFSLCAGALLLAALLSGCQGNPVGSDFPAATAPTQNTAPLISFTTPSDTSPATTQTEPTTQEQPPLSTEPVTRLSSIMWRTVPQLLSLGDGQVLACRNYFVEDTGIVNFLDVVDVNQDRVLVQSQNASPKELLEQQFADGHFVLKDSKTNTLTVCNRKLQIIKEFSAVNVDGYFSPDRKNYYFVNNHVLYRMDVATGNYARMSLQYDLRFHSLIGVHPDRNIVIAKFYVSFYNDNWGVCAIDCTNGKFVLLNEDVSHLWFNGDDFYGAVTNNSVYGADICFGNLTDGVQGKASTSALGSDTVSYTMLPGSGILLHRTVVKNNLSTTVYDLSRSGISSKLSQYGYTTSTLGAIYLRQEQLIFGVFPEEYDFIPVIINPNVLRYEKSLSLNKEIWPALVDNAVIQNYLSEVEGPTLPDNLQVLRQKADTMEKKYGITVLMENQTLMPCGKYAAVESDETAIADALTVLEQALSKYPEGFLSQFQNGIQEGGLYFCLTGSIQGSLNPVGKALKTGDRYEVVLDITSNDLEPTVHHELWHAIEMRLSTDSFDHPQWQAANPKGFLYYGHYDSGYQRLTQWTYAESGEQCCFVDAYSRINAREDRARLMETVMTADAADLLRSSSLRQKLTMMSQSIREHFNTQGWGTPYWERYL